MGYQKKDFNINSFGKMMLDADSVDMFNRLQEREQKILIARYGLFGDVPLTLAETGELFGVSPGRIRQVQCKAMAKLRGMIRENLFEFTKQYEIGEYDTISVRDFMVSNRVKTGLLYGGIATIRDLRERTIWDLLSLPGFGSKSVNELTQYIKDKFDIELEER